MEEVLAYLELKNRYYEKFYELTRKFTAGTLENRWDGIDLFIDSRERILNIIRSFDFKVATVFEKIALDPDQINEYRHRVKEILERRDLLVKKIVSLDLELMQRMDEVKSETIRELKHSISMTQQVQSFSKDPVLEPRKLKHSA
jgi:hypothetical protein